MHRGDAMSFLGKATVITRKDILSEVRTREIIFSALLFALLVIITFNFAFGGNRETLALVAPGILWVTYERFEIVSRNRTLGEKKEANGLERVVVAPMSRE